MTCQVVTDEITPVYSDRLPLQNCATFFLRPTAVKHEFDQNICCLPKHFLASPNIYRRPMNCLGSQQMFGQPTKCLCCLTPLLMV